MKPGSILILIVLLAGCQTWPRDADEQPEPEASAQTGTIGQCGAPPAMPPLDDSALAVIAWLHFNDQLASLGELRRWRLLHNYSTQEPGADLAASLVTSQPGMPDALRLVGQGTLKRRLDELPPAVQPVFTQVLAYNEAVLNHNAVTRELERARALYAGRVRQLEAMLKERDRQIEALTDIESQLNQNDGVDDSPGGGDAAPPPDTGGNHAD
ncbi:hypothetical protein [Saccharospirillum salsuginis]|uniref:YfhG lipoprotein n=1 Tax=Saccharospirillum salsuginis TaxID=418750 RepID=A0A918KMH7_9GAMM|nr:hypothetical protein [Saccharospirillum salsuginis]GGX67398.1 hypothetical protein GCM10007392_38750 [Saccharospirillum salsuginis]